MKKVLCLLSCVCCLLSITAHAQMPTAQPVAKVTAPAEKAGELESSEYEAPLTVVFSAQPEEAEGWTAVYEWHITKRGETAPRVVRNDENIEYTFLESGTWLVDLAITFTRGNEVVNYEFGELLEEPFSVGISESNLEFPNAFSPNGDGINDYLNAKLPNSKSLVEFEAAVFSRWGKKIYSWTDWQHKESGWDGTDGGHQCADGAYYLVVKAKGADGRKFTLKKTISVLTGYHEEVRD